MESHFLKIFPGAIDTRSHFATHGGTVNTFESRFAIGDEVVVLNNHYGTVVEVGFSQSKVVYNIDLDIGGETLCNVDSTFVEPAEGEYEEFQPLAPIFGPGGAVKLDPRGPSVKSTLADILGDPRVFNVRAQPRSFEDILRDAGFRCDEPDCYACGAIGSTLAALGL